MPLSNHPTPASGTSNGTVPTNIGGIPTGSLPISTHGMPALQHRWIARVEGTPKEFTEQTIACAINLVAKELALLVEQSVTSPTREHVVIQDWIDHPKRVVTLEVHNNNGSVVDTIKFNDCVLVDHVVDFNYGNVGAVVHVLGIKYDNVDLGLGKAQSAYASAMSVVGKP